MLLLGQNGICRGRSLLAFLAKQLILFLVYLLLISLKRRVVYTITSKTYNKIKTTHKTVKTEEDKVIKMFHALQGSRERKNR